ncbi:SDR family NAD(P)-dependent oxidoreductase [Curtobacterium herbarum]|uniref:SDR family NAD(P)-dependent oxidoreductase n=1 Tax=Curtobacterium herbarum TaxID=150122 RepID=A0ABP4K1A2_9MICO|nr:SDR family NAD(P)-dependent oxidoreductase [Curtobacterium herbarum]MBM7475322.1 NAD(P)-dependent dehydrogenase (short-subunit alcohol dehydrogenase family) [Curtobacterium herbarum]MCS6543238.1 SDR family NAD(P)-dependent oxidoreductase [Curtobacterium herbarum]
MSSDHVAPGGPDAQGGPDARPGLRTVVVTGASAGLGYQAAEQLAVAGHRVVLATRNPEKAAAAERSIRSVVPDASLEHVHLDLADLDSVRAAADSLSTMGPVHAVLNNAGVVGSRELRSTAQGYELQIGTNHLGHFAWTGLVLPMLQATGGRVVHLGSISHRWATLDRNDPLGAGYYNGYRQYARSKLAVMLFGFELAQRLADAGSAVSSVVAHPGLALESLTGTPATVSPSRPGPSRPRPSRSEPSWIGPGQRFVAQGKDAGAVPLVHASVGDDVRSGEYWGPDGWFQLRGRASVVPAEPRAHDRHEAARLWTASETASGVTFALDALG